MQYFIKASIFMDNKEEQVKACLKKIAGDIANIINQPTQTVEDLSLFSFALSTILQNHYKRNERALYNSDVVMRYFQDLITWRVNQDYEQAFVAIELEVINEFPYVALKVFVVHKYEFLNRINDWIYDES